MSKEDFEAIKELAEQKHAERVAKTPARLAYAQQQLMFYRRTPTNE